MNELDELRNRIDSIDNELLELLAQRVATIRAVGDYKKQHSLPPLASKRKNEVEDRWRTKAKSLGLSEEQMLKIYEVIHEYAIELESK